MKSTLDFHPKFLASLASYSKEKFTKDLMAGIIKIHIYMTPPSPAHSTARRPARPSSARASTAPRANTPTTGTRNRCTPRSATTRTPPRRSRRCRSPKGVSTRSHSFSTCAAKMPQSSAPARSIRSKWCSKTRSAASTTASRGARCATSRAWASSAR